MFWGGGQNECFQRLAALCAAALIATLALALSACAQPPTLQHTPLPAAPSPMPLPPTAAPISSARLQPAPAAPAPAPAPLPPTPANRPTSTPSAPPTYPPADVAFTQIAVGKDHACGLRENGIALCWGRDPLNQGSLDAPAQTAFSQIAAGRHFTCGLRHDASIACWGRNLVVQTAPSQGAFSEIAASGTNACALPISQGSQGSPPELLCWGVGFANGAETLPLDAPISDIQMGKVFVCGLTPQADMVCLSIDGQPAEITRGPFAQLAVGIAHVCALREDGSAHCQVRNLSLRSNPPPTEFVQIAAGERHSCGITRESQIECWGSEQVGLSGEWLTAPYGEFAAIFIAWQNFCALRPNGRAVCWRAGDYYKPSSYLAIANLPDGVSPAFGGAKFNTPVDIFPWPSGGLAIVHREGVIAARHDLLDPPPPQTILDISDSVVCCMGETGMLSAALDPQFQDFPFLYVWYRTLSDNALGEGAPVYVGRLARFRVNQGVTLKNSELPILEVPLPTHIHLHLGGAVRFGADGMLYLGIGDGFETPADAQSLNNLRGKIIRIDVRGANADQPYRIPPDNPFLDTPGALPEIWAYGLRNPWRMAFDPKNPARLFVADVGSRTREEVSIATAAANLGWPLCEADICQESLATADLANLVPPAVAYATRDIGCAIIGGVTVPWLDNRFIFSDHCSRRVWLLERDNSPDGAQPWRMSEIADLSGAARNILAFGAGYDDSVYILTYDGPIMRLDPRLADNLPDAPPDE